MNFEYLIDPISRETFFEEYYQKKHLLIKRKNTDYFQDFLNIEDIDDYLSKNNNYHPNVRVIKQGVKYTEKDYLKADSFGRNDIIDVEKLYKEYKGGASILLQEFERYFDKLKNLCLNLQSDTGLLFSSYVYVTPKNSKGFVAHYGTTDAFVVQLQGNRKWHLYDYPVSLPTSQQDYWDTEMYQTNHYADIKPTVTEILEPGDILYMPRGLVHQVEGLNQTSLHCTLGGTSPQWHNLLEHIAKDAYIFEKLRASIHIHDSKKFTRKALISTLKEAVNEIFEDEKMEDIVSSYMDKYSMHQRLSQDKNRLLDLEQIEDINPTTIVSRKKGINIKLLSTEEHIGLQFYEKNIFFPDFMEESIKFILNKDTFTVKDVLGDIDDESKVVCVSKLVEEGLLTIKQLNTQS